MADKRYAGLNGLSAVFAQIKAAINEKVTKVSGKDVVNVEVENLLCDEQTDGSYVLTAVVSSGMPTYNWGEGVPGGGSFTDITYEDWQLLSPEQQAAKDYYISDYPSSPLIAGIIGYDNTDSGMAADDVQEAIDEINSNISIYIEDTSITNVKFVKHGKIVYMILLDWVAPSFTIPTGFRPSTRVIEAATTYDYNDISISFADILPDGTLTLGNNNQVFFGTFSWLTA